MGLKVEFAYPWATSIQQKPEGGWHGTNSFVFLLCHFSNRVSPVLVHSIQNNASIWVMIFLFLWSEFNVLDIKFFPITLLNVWLVMHQMTRSISFFKKNCFQKWSKTLENPHSFTRSHLIFTRFIIPFSSSPLNLLTKFILRNQVYLLGKLLLIK